MRRLLKVLMGSIAILAPRLALAQTCLGFAPFSTGRIRGSVGYQDGAGTDLYRGELGYGRASSDFGALGFQHAATRNQPAGFTSSSNRVDALAGRQFSLGGPDAVQFCPIARLGYASTPFTFPSGTTTVHSVSYGFGSAVGFNIPEGSSARIVPSLAVEYVGSRANGTSTVAGTSRSLRTQTNSSGLWTLSLGVGAGGFTVSPYINHAFGIPNAIGYWGVMASINLGAAGG